MKRVIIMSLLGLICLTAVNAQTKKVVKSNNATVEVLYFHSKQRCPTCIAVGTYSKEVVNNDFAAQVKSGAVKFKEIDISTPQGEKLADRYHVTWSSLYVNRWQNGKEVRNDMTTFGFENARTNTPAFKSGLKNKISKLLK
jgi:ABC-type uncharacterized transport system involved in gliding motility auxiliary subunit